MTAGSTIDVTGSSTVSPDTHDPALGATSDAAVDQAPYRVVLPIFEGPLDLLLHLIERNQLEITAVSLVAITDQFVEYLRAWDEPPISRLAEFVAMAARLLLIKSRSLLPRQPQVQDDDDDEPLDDAEALRRHLIEYKMARDIATMLKERELAGLQSFPRPGRMLVDPEALLAWSPPKLVGLDVNALALVFRRVVAVKRLTEPEELPRPQVTVAEKIAVVEERLRTQPRLSWEELLMREADSRFALVVTFLAVLELWHQARVDIRQEALFGAILITRGARFDAPKTNGGLSSEFDPESVPVAAPAPDAVATDDLKGDDEAAE